MVDAANVLCVLGGSWHDFDGFAHTFTPVLARAGMQNRCTQDLDELTRLQGASYELVLLYTCIDEQCAVAHSQAQVHGLCSWVQGGGSLLAVHGATVAARQHPDLKELLGGCFVSHPPRARLVVSPVPAEHPITRGIEPFTVDDELYYHDYDPAVSVHLVTHDGQRACPLAWSRPAGQGTVVYFGLGHDEAAWNVPSYQRIVQQSARWLVSHL